MVAFFCTSARERPLLAKHLFHVTNLAADLTAGFVGGAARLHVPALGCSTDVLFCAALHLCCGSLDFIFRARLNITDSRFTTVQAVNASETLCAYVKRVQIQNRERVGGSVVRNEIDCAVQLRH